MSSRALRADVAQSRATVLDRIDRVESSGGMLSAEIDGSRFRCSRHTLRSLVRLAAAGEVWFSLADVRFVLRRQPASWWEVWQAGERRFEIHRVWGGVAVVDSEGSMLNVKRHRIVDSQVPTTEQLAVACAVLALQTDFVSSDYDDAAQFLGRPSRRCSRS